MPVCYRHPDRETYVRCTRCDRPICPDDMVPASVGFQCPDDARAGARSVRPARTAVGGRLTDGRATVTLVLIGLNVLVQVVTAAGGSSLGFGGGASPLYDALAMQPVSLLNAAGTVVPGVADGQWWRLVTATFLHFGWLHLAFNMLALLQLGTVVEAALGRARFLALYLLAGIAGTTASYVLGPTNLQAAGASGAIFGLFGAAYVLERRRGGAAAGQYLALIVVNLVLTFSIPNIDIRGHLGGLVMGGLAALVLVAVPAGPRRGALQGAGLAGLAALLVVAVVLRTAALTG